MAAVEAVTPNGIGSDDAPTPDAGVELNGDSASEDGDLFGDDDEEEQDVQTRHRKLDDEDLDSGDDLDRTDRVQQTVEDDEAIYEEKQVRMYDVDLAPVRQPAGDELYLLQMPEFLGLNHRNFDPATYNPPERPHDGRDPTTDPSVKFSAFSTATSTMYWRRDPKTPELLQSNARIVRWSDGSLTLQLASKPTEHYRISTTALRQAYDPKLNKLRPHTSDQMYDANKDTHNFLVTPHDHAVGIDFQTVRPLDAAIRIQASGDIADASVLELQRSLAANKNQKHDPLLQLKTIKVDPDKARRDAEEAEKKVARDRRKLENAREREIYRKDRVLGRSGIGGSRSYGLSVAGLEDDDGMPSARPTKAKPRRRMNRHGEIYSDDEDETMPRGRTREDEYDREDDFLADSEEEPEVYDDDEEEELLDDDEDAEGEVDDAPPPPQPASQSRREQSGTGREGTPKRPISEDEEGGRAGGGGAGGASPQARKKRRVIDDEDDE